MKSFKQLKEEIELTDAYGDTFAVIQDVVKPEPLKPSWQQGEEVPCAPVFEDDVQEKFKSQYGKPDKMSQSSERKSLGRRSSTKDGSKPSGYESKKEFRDKSMPLRKFRDRFQREGVLGGAGIIAGGLAAWQAIKGMQTVNKIKKDAEQGTGFAGRLKQRRDAINAAGMENFDPIAAGVTSFLEDWQKKSGKNQEGGLNEKGRKSYERQNPGSDLKAPTKKKGNPRRASFCARMKGMKKKLTSKKTASDPDSRINKSLRKWDC